MKRQKSWLKQRKIPCFCVSLPDGSGGLYTDKVKGFVQVSDLAE